MKNKTKCTLCLFSSISLTPLPHLFPLRLKHTHPNILPRPQSSEAENWIRPTGGEDGTRRTENHRRGRNSAPGRAAQQHKRHFKTPPRSLWYAKCRSLKWLSWQAFIVPETKKWHFSEITFLWIQTHANIKWYKLLTGPLRRRGAHVLVNTHEVTQSSLLAQRCRRPNKKIKNGGTFASSREWRQSSHTVNIL